MTMNLNRRSFLGRSAAVAGGAILASPALQGLIARSHESNRKSPLRVDAAQGRGGYGALRPAGPELALPEGFQYRAFGQTATMMSDGAPTPAVHDGMAAFALPNGHIRLVRNHEIRNNPATSGAFGDVSKAYDPKAGGGTTSLEINPVTRELVRDFISLNGTITNCAGGLTPWGAWLTCEEDTRGLVAGYGQPHGYIFEVPSSSESTVQGVPLKAMGRFVHEAIAVDPFTGIVYETEDRGTSGFYRFIPAEPGQLVAGGQLQMLAVKDRSQYDTRRGQSQRAPMLATWVDIDDPDPANAEADSLAVFNQGFAKGGAVFARLEGTWYGNGSIYFNSTSGGDAGQGQVWEYRPLGPGASDGLLSLVFESPGAEVLNSPDNITVSPRGGLILCEDGSGQIFKFAENLISGGEFAGACYSPDGQTLFVNIQSPGTTFAIWGPWERGAL
jgi:hypothetical protein